MTFAGASQARLYGLLYVSPYREPHANLNQSSGNPVDIYLLCAALCATSVAACGGKFALISNDVRLLRDRCKALGIADLELIGYAFKWPVPEGIAFHSAHYKLELIEAFGTGQFGERAGLIDIDTILWKPLELPPPAGNSLIVYDITDAEIGAYGLPCIRHDLELVAGRPLPDPRWYAGEFLVSTAAGFAGLAEMIRKVWPNYLNVMGSLRHIGDEMVVSAAINLAAEAGAVLINADRVGGVIRWWSARTILPMPPFSQIINRSLLHLPSDKAYLASFPRNSFSGPRFVANYRSYLARKLLMLRIVNAFSNCFGAFRGGQRFVAKLD